MIMTVCYVVLVLVREWILSLHLVLHGQLEYSQKGKITFTCSRMPFLCSAIGSLKSDKIELCKSMPNHHHVHGRCRHDHRHLQLHTRLSTMAYGPEIGGTRNTSCAIWCLEIKAFFDYKMLHGGRETIVTNGVLDNINNRVFKLPRLANFNLHRNLT